MVTKLVIPVAGLGTRFLPLTRVVPKELWPLVDRPVIQYILEGAKSSGIKEVIFVLKKGKEAIVDYFKPAPELEKILEERKKQDPLQELRRIEELCSGLTFRVVYQKEPLGDGHALLQAKRLVGDEPWAVSWGDDVFDAPEPVLKQLIKVFDTSQKPTIALYSVAQERLPFYGVAGTEKIADRFFKIKSIVEKPSIEEAPSDLVFCGRYVLTSEVFDYLKAAKPSEKGEVILAEVLADMLESGKMIFGYEINGKWLECGNKLSWLKSHLELCLKDPRFGESLKKHLKGLL